MHHLVYPRFSMLQTAVSRLLLSVAPRKVKAIVIDGHSDASQYDADHDTHRLWTMIDDNRRTDVDE